MKFKKIKVGIHKEYTTLKREGWYCCEGMTVAWAKDLLNVNDKNVLIDIAVEGSKYNIVGEKIYFCPWCGEKIVVIK